ncbi:cytosine deaminase-like metal-dependent hydrolase [Halobacteroides halobius DSM 5150]|uniref:Cytosine deaminase-like metal-dependent hydrolase n=1 Tax=Halobacteroides halobius (strain ATCC 35273 / DSM 5150 / MD-1) TaxID=748449 RepID=L0K6W0_HALHC|nr:8-oxoguanine deaminase [Halobacteroides halobius]AGB41007.1 cytosine deaminase-like metal-dependent hydrolase [Halobacteroides halobius DSM 5150]
MSSILIKNVKEIITMDQKRNRLQGYDILIEENKISKIDQEIKQDAEEVIDGTDYFLYPGLINTHHHFYQTLTRNIAAAQNIELFDWLKYLYPIWANLTPRAVYYSTLVACGELLKTGCTTAVDQFYVFPHNQPDNLIDQQFRAAHKIGIRFHGSRGSMSLSEKDGGLPPDEVVQTEEEILQDSQRVIEKYHDNDPFSMQRVILAPCSPFSVTENLMKESIKLARRYGVQSHTHLAETKDEEEFCQETFGMRPLEYMKKVNWIGDDVWYAHGIHLTKEELKRMAETKTGVAHCPVSNQKLASGAAKVPYMLEEGVPVGLAVDGSASNDSSNMILEMKAAFLLHRLVSGISSITAEDVLAMATNGGRNILNQSQIGSIEEGKAADMFMVNKNRLGFAGGLSDPVSALVNTGDTQIVDMTIVNGEIVVRNGELVAVDESEIINKANKVSQEMINQ